MELLYLESNQQTRNFGSAFLFQHSMLAIFSLIFHELLSRDHEGGLATGQPQGVGSEAYLNATSQGPTPEDARKDGQIRGRSK
jgi:hypothetical protein